MLALFLPTRRRPPVVLSEPLKSFQSGVEEVSALTSCCGVRGQVREGLGWYFTRLKSSTVVSTGGFFQ